ncbi:zinc ribbon domain-containing protein [Ktedonobacter robiniae]|nr:zinc ribbon domain-containing protein [Ktedonobacter robiniae]
MLHCQACGAEIPSDGARFCGNCGQPIPPPQPVEAPAPAHKTPSFNENRSLADEKTVRGMPPEAASTSAASQPGDNANDFSFQEFQSAKEQEAQSQSSARQEEAKTAYGGGEHFGAPVEAERPQAAAPSTPPAGYAAPPQMPPRAPMAPGGSYAPPASIPDAAYPPAAPASVRPGMPTPQATPYQPGGYPPPATPYQSGAFQQQQSVPSQPGYPPLPPAGTPPAFPGTYPTGAYPPPQQKKSWLSTTAGKVTIGLLIVVLLLGGIGVYAVYQLTRPKPIINVTSSYKVGSVPAGSTSTSLHVTGQQFSNSSDITFLLDGNPIAGQSPVLSDKDGKISSDLKIDTGWSIGQHTLTAKDAGGYTTKDGIPIDVVPEGQAHTPGPKGSPSDDQSFRLEVLLMGQDSESGKPFTSKATLIVTGHADPAGGSICTQYADGQPHTATDTSASGANTRETMTSQCDGNYKSGKVDYTEKLLQDSLEITEQGQTFKCTLDNSGTAIHLTGNFDSPSSAKGTFDNGTQSYTCNIPGASKLAVHDTGSWTGLKVA